MSVVKCIIEDSIEKLRARAAADKALNLALDIARKYKAEVEILHVIPPLLTPLTRAREIELGKKFNLILRLRKHTLDELMSEYRKIKEEMHQKSEEQAEI